MNTDLLNGDGFPERPDERTEEVLAVLEECLAELERGGRPRVEEIAARHPELADALADYLRDLEQLHGASSTPLPNQDLPAAGVPGPGRLGDFRLLREVGRGGMGVVYEAEQVSLGRRVALKVLPFAATLDVKHLQRFRNEAQAAASLHHPHIVPVYGVGSERDVHYYAMQFIDGYTLAEVIADVRAATPGWWQGVGSEVLSESEADEPAPRRVDDTTPRPSAALSAEPSAQSPAYFRAVARLGVQAALALEHAHQVGVVHRDIKPANLLVDPTGNLWVTDFGLARCRSEQNLTRTGDVIGTLRYMSPEQALGKRGLVDHRSDIYSLGVTLYEALTLEPAYPERDRQELLRQIALSEPLAPRRINPAVPVDLETVILKAMAREPERRYATAQELADDLGRFLDNKPVLARRPTPRERLAKWARRHRSVVAAAAGILILAVAGLAVGTFLLWQEQGRTKAALDDVATERDAAQSAQLRAESAQFRADQNFRRALKGVSDLLWRLESPRWRNRPELAELREDLAQQGVSFFQELVQEGNTDPRIRFQTARAYDWMSSVYYLQKKADKYEETLRHALALYEGLVTDFPENADYRLALAMACIAEGNWHTERGHPREAEEAFSRSVEHYTRALPYDPSGRAPNNLACLLCNCPQPALRDFPRAVTLAEQAVTVRPGERTYWNTLGMARYWAGDWAGAVPALKKSMAMSQGGDGFDWFLLAMTSWRLGDRPAARAWYDKAERWAEEHPQSASELSPYRQEAAALLGIAEPSRPPAGKPEPPANGPGMP